MVMVSSQRKVLAASTKLYFTKKLPPPRHPDVFSAEAFLSRHSMLNSDPASGWLFSTVVTFHDMFQHLVKKYFWISLL